MLKNAPYLGTLRAEMLSFPAGRHDDCVDVGLVGQLADKMHRGRALRPMKPPKLKDRWDRVFGEDDDGINWKTH